MMHQQNNYILWTFIIGFFLGFSLELKAIMIQQPPNSWGNLEHSSIVARFLNCNTRSAFAAVNKLTFLSDPMNDRMHRALNFNDMNLSQIQGYLASAPIGFFPEKISFEGARLTDQDFEKLLQDTQTPHGPVPSSLMRMLPSVQQLSFKTCSWITDANVQALAQKLSNLKSLDLWGCQDITDVGLQSIVRQCSNLQSLNLASCSITDASIRALAPNYKNLINIDLSCCSQVTNTGLQIIAHNCSNLRKLWLAQCKITNANIQALAALQNLESLNLNSCPQITDIDIQLLARCPELCELIISGCHQITDVSVFTKYPKLQKLSLAGCTGIKNISALAQCYSLEILNLTFCSDIRDISALALCPSLKNLDISGCSSITNITALAGCPNLQRLYLINCKKITDISALALCPSLKILSCSWCNRITTAQIQALQTQRPDIEILR